MAKVKMSVGMASADFAYSPNDEIEVSLEIAKAWQEADIAVIVEETAAVKPKETAAKKKPTTRKKG